MHGYGLCLWRLGRFEEAEHIFDRMLWLNPSDNQGARFLIDDVKARIGWEDHENRYQLIETAPLKDFTDGFLEL